MALLAAASSSSYQLLQPQTGCGRDTKAGPLLGHWDPADGGLWLKGTPTPMALWTLFLTSSLPSMLLPFLISLIKVIPGLKFFHRQKAGSRHGGGLGAGTTGSCSLSEAVPAWDLHFWGREERKQGLFRTLQSVHSDPPGSQPPSPLTQHVPQPSPVVSSRRHLPSPWSQRMRS